MTTVIIDNATLTAVQRITGEINVPRSYDVEADLAAFEGFLIALLFYDNHYFIDDYKQEHKDSRQANFSYLQSLSSELQPYKALSRLAQKQSSNILLESRGSNIRANEIGRFLEQIGLHLSANWVMRSSVWWLTLRALSRDDDYADEYKYSKLTTAIFDQLRARNEINGTNRLRSFDGRLVAEIKADDHRVDSQIEHFSASLNWLSFRSIFYLLFSEHYGFSVCLHPIRHTFVLNYLSRMPENTRQTRALLNSFGEAATSTVRDINQKADQAAVAIELPWISAWLIGKYGSPRGAVDAARDMRENRSFGIIRGWFQELGDLQSAGDIKNVKREIIKLKFEIERKLASVRTDFGFRPSPASNPVSVSLSGLSMTLNEPQELLARLFPIGRRSRVSGLVRDITSDIASFQDLGDVRGAILRSVCRDENTPGNPIFYADQAKFRLGRPWWKKPL